ncbi:MAG TPA: PAC2 family protein [Candidatus Thermoplasmatota archaeon]|nr:PAC2 family protein [Candidatus Thermoplasmatota archaeon]
MAAGPIETFHDVDLKDALVLVAFPTTGSAANIAAHYLVEQLELPVVGHVRVQELQSVIAIQEGRATSPVRIFGGDVACRLEEACPRVYIVTSDLPVGPNVLGNVGELVVAWASQGKARLIIVLEGVVRNEGDDVPDVFVASAEARVLRELQKAELPAMGRALLGGISARILLGSPGAGIRSGALIVEAKREHPDGRAAAALVSALARFLPDVVIDETPLLEESRRIEEEIRRATAPAAPQAHASFI